MPKINCEICEANLELNGQNTVVDKTINMESELCDECFDNCIVSFPPEFDSSGSLLIS